MNLRIKQLISSFDSYNIDSFLVTNDVDISYLTNYTANDSWLFVTPKRAYYLTDFRYVLEAKKGLRGVFVRRYKKSLPEEVLALAHSQKVKRIGIDSRHLSHFSYKCLYRQSSRLVKLITVNNFIGQQRQIKTRGELIQIKKAISLTLKAFKSVRHFIRPGITENDIFTHLERFVKNRKVAFSFNPIIASGSNSCLPHAQITRRQIKRNDIVLVDVGIDVNGYKSDLTRMFFLGKIPTHIQSIYEDVSAAQAVAIQEIRPGIPAKKIDFQARNYLKTRQLDKYFGHSLGHGVGREIHEEPIISPQSSVILKEGMVFTIEPAVYIPHKFGIRIEDMVLVTKSGYKILSRSTK